MRRPKFSKRGHSYRARRVKKNPLPPVVTVRESGKTGVFVSTNPKGDVLVAFTDGTCDYYSPFDLILQPDWK